MPTFLATKSYRVSIDPLEANPDIDAALAFHDQAIYGLIESACELADAGESEGTLTLIDLGEGCVLWEEDPNDDAQVLYGPVRYEACAIDFDAQTTP